MSKRGPHPQNEHRSRHGQEASIYRFLALAQEDADVFWILTPTGEAHEFFANWQTFTGQRESDFLGRGWLDALYPPDQQRVEDALARSVASGHTHEITCYMRRQKDNYHAVCLRIIPVHTADGSVGEVIVRGKNIAGQKMDGRMSEAQIQLALKASRIGMWDWDIPANRLTWTDQRWSLFGLPPDASISFERFLAAIHPDDRERVKQIIQRTLIEKTEYCTEYRAIWPDGSIHWQAVRGQGIYDARGQAVHMIGAAVDITNLKQAEESLIEANKQISAILESITDAFLYTDAEWRLIYANQHVETYLCKRREEFAGRALWDAFPELLGTPFEQACRKARITRQTVHIEFLCPLSSRWYDVCAHPVSNSILIYMHDVTQHRQTEEALRESELRFRSLVDSNVIGIIVAGVDGGIREANDAFLSLVGYTREDLEAGKLNWRAMTPPEYRTQEMRAFEEERENGYFRAFEKEYITKDGRRVPILLGGTSFRWGDSLQLQICFVLDLTARREAERQKDLFLGIASHELKTPLAALKGTLQLVERRMRRMTSKMSNLPEDLSTFMNELAKNLATSVRQVDVQTHLINDLLDVSRITANRLELSPQPCDLCALVRETVEDLRMTAPDRTLLLTLPENITIPAFVDIERISQVITNYITNAIRYSNRSKPVSIEVSAQEDSACVRVRDRGPGLSEEAQKEVWQRFYQVKGLQVQHGSGKGLGLGLYICRMLIEQHGGKVGVESTPGQGCVFWFTLPLGK